MLVLLFTDLVASTRLWERQPDAMRTALARHDAILREAVVATGGSIVKTTGDGLMATFVSVSSCLASCIDAQRTLGGTPWETDEPLRVRMGINVGEAEERAGDFYGTAVNRAARIMAAGHGGQVLVSALAAQLARDGLPAGASLLDLGAHRLKDLTEPEHLFQLAHDDLATDFPPLATLDSRPNNLPVQVSEFFGRHAEMTAARVMLSTPGVRLVTLTGPGGTGKTRLALQVAAELVDSYRDGVFIVDLSAERDADAAFEAVLRDLGIASTRDGSPLQVLKAKLADRNMLIVLDNFEQVTDAAVGVSEILLHCPDIVVVATSREALRLRGEHVLAVPPLTLPDPAASLTAISQSEAVDLFVDRARSARADFALTAENASAVAEITVRLDGLPLAIELAAARLRLFTVGELLERLRTRLDVLGSGARDLPGRQRTLRSTIEWSYDLLDTDECRVFQMMSVFSSARLETVEAVAAAVYDDIDALGVLSSLVDKSLISSVDEGAYRRFTLLQTIRSYASERLDSVPSESAAIRLAHARHFAELTAELLPGLESADGESAMSDMLVELGNLRSAWQYWVEARDLDQMRRLMYGLWIFHDANGWYQGVIDLMTDFLGVLESGASPETPEEEMTVRSSLGRALTVVRGYTGDADEQFNRILELSHAPGTSTPIPILRALANYHSYRNDMPKAAALGRQIFQQAELLDDALGSVEGHLVFGYTTAMLGDLEDGLRHLDIAVDLFEGMSGGARFRGGPSPGVVACNASALLLRQGGWAGQAGVRAARAMAVARSLNHPLSLAYALYHTGLLHLFGRDFDRSMEHARELAMLAADNDWPVWRALASVLDGVSLVGTGAAEDGIAMTEAGNDVYRGLTTPPVFWPGLVGLRGIAFAMAGRMSRALELADEALEAAGPNEGYYPHLRLFRADCLAGLPESDPETVEGAYRDAIRVARTAFDRMSELAATSRLVVLLRSRGALGGEHGELERLVAAFTESFDQPELVEAQAVLANSG